MWQVEQAQAQARLQVAIDRERRLAQELQTAAQRLESLQRELSSLETADSALAEQLSVWALDLASRREQLADVESRLADAEEAVRVADETLRAADAALGEVRRGNGALADEYHASSLRHTQLAGRRDALRERLETEWRRPLDDLLASFEAVEIDTTARELFLATFAQARENFRQIFMTLFGGGECDLRLENPDAPLDCDIEIHASPRGKRTQRIHLLSSGERALVALSLLFGMPAGRGGRAARRPERRALRPHAEPVQDQDAVHHHHAQPAHDHRGGRRGVRGDDAGAGRLVAGVGAHARAPRRRRRRGRLR